MKAIAVVLTLLIASTGWTSCQRTDAKCIDLATGDTIMVKKDATTGEMVEVNTGKPVRLYVDTKTNDTIYGPTATVVNREVIKTYTGHYVYNGDEEYKRKMEAEANKVKTDEGAYTIKDGDYKKKVEADGDVKIKDGDKKIKIDR